MIGYAVLGILRLAMSAVCPWAAMIVILLFQKSRKRALMRPMLDGLFDKAAHCVWPPVSIISTFQNKAKHAFFYDKR